MIHWAHASPKPKRHLGWFSRFCTDDRRVSPYFTMVRPFSPSKLPLSMGDLDPCKNLIHGSLSPPESSTQTATRSLQPFLQGSLVWLTDRPTDHDTRSVTIGCMYVRSTAMRRYYVAIWTFKTFSKLFHLNSYILCRSIALKSAII